MLQRYNPSIMVKNLLAPLCLLLLTFISYGQNGDSARYRDFIFSEVNIIKDLSYVRLVPSGVKKEYYSYDLYQSFADSVRKGRPLIIWMHGGGFKYESKDAAGIQLWCASFAQRGYVCAAINYRLTKKNTLFKFKALVSGCADGVEDARQAIRYFKDNARKFRIDTNQIILAGNSAGAMIALQAAYSTPAELAKLAEDSTLNLREPDPGKIACVINFWGAMFDIDWLKNAKVPIVSVHGRNDNTVPVTKKGSNFYGSLPIHKEADTLHIPNKLKIYYGYSHELERVFTPFYASRAAKQRWLEAGQFAADFLYETLFKNTAGTF